MGQAGRITVSLQMWFCSARFVQKLVFQEWLHAHHTNDNNFFLIINSPARSEIKSFEFGGDVYSFEDNSFCKPDPNSPFDRLFKSLDKVSANVNNNFPTVFRLAACECLGPLKLCQYLLCKGVTQDGTETVFG